MISVWLSLLPICLLLLKATGMAPDPKGYIVYCPCMGRFGNQADQFLGSLGFAKALDRTLVLPAWVEYRHMQVTSVQVPFDTYFKVAPLQKYHRVITMETFMMELAETVWPVGNRTAFCYSSRRSSEQKAEGCHAKDGNPFKSFWDTYNVDFDESQFFGPLYYDTENSKQMREWNERYPPSKYPVLAFTGPPAAFPVQEQHVKLHKYLHWSNNINSKVQDFIHKHIPEHPFLGIHLRNGIDFKNACEHIQSSPSMFAAAQCIGYRSEFGPATYQMCYPDDKIVIEQVKEQVIKMGAKFVFVATDDRDMISLLSKDMKKIRFIRLPIPADPMLDLAILGQADHFIGNCISTFSAFVKRERDFSSNKSSSFWAFKHKSKEEL